MGLRCLIGHDYGEPQTSRDVAERGNEVVVTVREYRECARCGHTRILSENKEIKAGGAGEPEGDAAADAEASWQSEEPDDGQSTVEAFSRPEPEREMTAEEDDGIILEDEPEAGPERARGQWPEADLGEDEAEGETEHEPWPDEEGPPEPDEPGEPDEDRLDAGPEPSAADGEEQTEILTDDDGHDEPDPDPEPEVRPDDPPRPDNRDREFVCPDCGETWPTRNASLRPGDICPSCKRGYIQEQVVQ